MPPGWEDPITGELYEENPRHTVPEETWRIVRLWRIWRGDGFGRGPLPFGGGPMQQPAVLLDAFEVLDGAFAAYQALRKGGGADGG